MFRWFISLILTLLLVVSTTLKAQPQELIWLSSSEPGKPLIQGVDNIDLPYRTFQLIFQYLPQYKPVFKVQNTLRAFHELEQGDNLCTDSKIRTRDRLNRAVVTQIPQLVKLGLRLVVYQDEPLLEQYYPATEVDLMQVMKSSPQLSLAVVAGRSYGTAMDELLAGLEGDHQVWHRSAEYGTNGGLALLLRKRVKMTLEYPSAVERMLRYTDMRPELKMWSLKDGTQYQQGYIFCSNSEFGKQLVKDLDQAITQASKTRAYFEQHLKYTPQELKPQIRKYYNQVYATSF